MNQYVPGAEIEAIADELDGAIALLVAFDIAVTDVELTLGETYRADALSGLETLFANVGKKLKALYR